MRRYFSNIFRSAFWPPILLLIASILCSPGYAAGGDDASAGGSALFPRCGGLFDLCGYHDRKTGNEVIPQTFERAMLFSDGFAAVRINGLFGYIDSTGKVVIEPRFDLAGPFHGEFAEILVGQNTGVIDRTGKIVLQPEFGSSVPLAGDIVIARSGRYKPARSPESEQLEPFNGLLLMRRTPMGLYQLNKGWLTTETYEFKSFESGNKRFLWAREPGSGNSRYGLMSLDGKWKLEPAFDAVRNLDEDGTSVLATVKEAGRSHRRTGFVDREGNLVVLPIYDSLTSWQHGYAGVLLNGKEGFIDRKGRLLGGRLFEKVERDPQGLPSKVLLHSKWRAISADGTIADIPDRAPSNPGDASAPASIDNMECRGGLSLMEKDGLWGMKAPDGRVLIEPKFEAISCFKQGIAWAPDRAKNAWCPVGPDGVTRAKPDCQLTYYEFDSSHYYPEKLDADPFESSVLWMKAFLKLASQPAYPSPRLIGDGIQGDGTINAWCRDLSRC